MIFKKHLIGSKFAFIRKENMWAVHCKVCGHQTTQYNYTKKAAAKEHRKRGHSKGVCEWMKTAGGYYG